VLWWAGKSEGLIVPLQLDDLAASGVDLHLDLMAIDSFDFPHAVVEFDFFDLNDALSKAIFRTSSRVRWAAKAGATEPRLMARASDMRRIEIAFPLGTGSAPVSGHARARCDRS
jgi:hypothetical protein